MIPYVLALTGSEIFGFCSLYRYSKTNQGKHLGFAILGYFGLFCFLLLLLKNKNINMLRLNLVWQVTAILMGSLSAYAFFGERLDNPIQYLGLLLGILSIIMVNLKV